MTELIKQRTPHDCAVACMAMLQGWTWECTNEVVGHLVEYEKHPRGMRHEQEAIRLLGYESKYDNGHAVGDVIFTHRPYGIAPEYYRDMAWGRRALLTVPSLNIPNGHHMVYYDGHQLYDPSTKLTYSSFTQLMPSEIIVFREGAR